jgi:sec-independent protein translocase protein TatA
MLAIGPLGIGPFELVLILAVVVIIFGVGRLPEIGGAVGKSIREFRKSAREADEEGRRELSEPEPRSDVAPPAAKAPSAAGSTVACPRCGTSNAAGTKFCSECGASLQVRVNCSQCGASNAAGAKFCSECGASLQAPVN